MARTAMKRGTKRLPRVSTKTAARDRRYANERRVFLDSRPRCELLVSQTVCRGEATEVHHQAGRAPSVFFDQSLWLPACHWCHQHVTDHPTEAYARGWSVRRNEAS